MKCDHVFNPELFCNVCGAYRAIIIVWDIVDGDFLGTGNDEDIEYYEAMCNTKDD